MVALAGKSEALANKTKNLGVFFQLKAREREFLFFSHEEYNIGFTFSTTAWDLSGLIKQSCCGLLPQPVETYPVQRIESFSTAYFTLNSKFKIGQVNLT